MLVFDGTLYLSASASSAEGHRSGMYKLTAAGDGRIREHPAYAQLQDRVHEISQLKAQF